MLLAPAICTKVARQKHRTLRDRSRVRMMPIAPLIELAPDSEASARARLPGLDALRAIAVLLTYIMHFSWLYAATFLAIDLETQRATAKQSFEQQWVTVQYYSLYGVYLFFMISGLLIGRKWLTEDAPFLGEYLRDRAVRIFPTFWIALAVAALLAAMQPAQVSFGLIDIAANATLLNWFAPHASPPWLIVSWSLQIEWIFYLAMPLIALVLRAVPSQQRLLVLWCLTLALTVALKALGERYFAYPAYFSIGISVALRPHWGTLASQKLKLTPLVAALLVLHFGYATIAAVGAAKQPWAVGHFDLFALLFLAIGGAIFIKITFHPPRRLITPVILSLGRVSYSFYLWHLLVLIGAYRLIDKLDFLPYLRTLPWGARWFLLFVACGFASVIVSQVSYRLFEKPYFATRKN